MNERIKKIRKKFDMTQEEFSSKIGLSRNFIAQIETGAKKPSDRTISDICREFNINEDWLRTGAGGEENMLIPEDMTYLYNVGKLGSEQNEFKKFYLNMMMNLPDEYWNYIYREFKKFDKKNKE